MAESPAVPAREGEPPGRFRATVHGTCFADREQYVATVRAGDPLLLIPGPPTDDDPGVWVHLMTGDPVGHLPPEIERWLVPWMQRGGRATARAVRVGDADTPSWRRLIIEVETVKGC
jgi:hypothetical protein